MTTAQKNAYLEAHMAVQQHMAQAAMQLKQQHQQQIMHRNDQNTSGNQQPQHSPSVSSTQHYGNTIKVK